ncbi:outer membrane beta-barrel protein [Legionella worsleiensis]|uniref:Outer membrane protein A n=1 Tax=Legionella worsleiensis TaxID=45076 RepID=A0A0W1A5X7_9GAMM|nr:outer membrane beta-barrel protein [Legionella worsleiensis]KTD76741.1 outer membrane protein A [Legionella worsleiensis]STY30537.1 Outer membrane protein II [Legionella worsleiensis]
MNKAIKLGLVSLLLCSGIQSINAATPGYYAGIGLGVSQLADIENFYQLDHDALAGRFFLGYNINEYLGVETSYSELGETRYYIPGTFVTGDYSIYSLSLVGKLYLPLGNQSPANLYALVGASQLWGKFDISYGSLPLLDFSSDGTALTIGAGVSYDINQYVTLNGEITAYTDREQTDAFYDSGIPKSILATVGLAYKF